MEGLSVLDIRLLIRIIGDAVVAEGGFAGKRKFLLGSVAELIAAEAWAWSWQAKNAELIRSGLPQIVAGGDETILPASFLQPPPDRLSARFNTNRVGRTKSKSLRSKKDYGPIEYSYVPSRGEFTIGLSCRSEKLVSSIIFVRNSQRRAFTARETKIVEMIGQEVVWLHDPDRSAPVSLSAPRLSPKRKRLVEFLVAGLNRKAIAARMNISVNTAHSYIKSIYSAYGVNSQAELTRIFADNHYGK